MNNLSPVVGPGADTSPAFRSVASAFDFQHHVGTNPASELLVLKRILHRECLLSRLETTCADLRKQFRRSAAFGGYAALALFGDRNAGVIDMLSRMREATVAVVEAVGGWREDMAARHPPLAFTWHGDNYLLKITNDLNFLAGVEPLASALKVHRHQMGVRRGVACACLLLRGKVC